VSGSRRELPERDRPRRDARGGPDPGRAESRDPHAEEQGCTAEDGAGVGRGEEGFLAEEYPGHNALRGESERERKHRAAVTWTWPRVGPELEEGVGERADLEICREIGRRIGRAEARPIRIVATVLEGEVTLEGEVETLADKHVIEGTAGSIEGVVRLDSRLVAAGPHAT